MLTSRILTKCARSVSLLVTDDGCHFDLPRAAQWVLRDAKGRLVCRGETAQVGVFIAGLAPATDYVFEVDAARLTFSTLPCGGAVDARDFGLDAKAVDNRKALQDAINAVPVGGTLLVPAGRYFTGPLYLKSNMTLHLAEGAELAAIAARDTWDILPAMDAEGRHLGSWEGAPSSMFAALLTAVDCIDLKLTGPGLIDGGGARGDWWTWPKETRNGARRPRILFAVRCDGLAVSGLTIRNSPAWTLHPMRCENAHFSNLTILNPPDSPNTDGLNPESCRNVDITAVRFSVGDDCIAIKAGKRLPLAAGDNSHLWPTTGINIAHCLMEHGHGAVVIGSEMSGGVSDVDIRHCQFRQTDRGLRIKTRRGRGGAVRGITMHDVLMEDVRTPFSANAFYFCDPDGRDDWVQSRLSAPVDAGTPRIAHIWLRDVKATGVITTAAALLGLPEMPIKDVTLTNYSVAFAPEAQPEVPLMALDVSPICKVPMAAEFAEVAVQNFMATGEGV